MSHAKKGKCRYALCSHISISGFVLFHRAKPVTEMERSGIEVHCGIERSKIEARCGVERSKIETPANRSEVKEETNKW